MNRGGALGQRRRGEPALALAVVLGTWILARGAVLAWPDDPASDHSGPVVSQALSVAAKVETARTMQIATEQAPGQLALALPPPTAVPSPNFVLPDRPPHPTPVPKPMPTPEPQANGSARLAAGHQLLYLAAFAELPLPPEVLAVRPDLAPRRAPALPGTRWSGDGWLMWRQGDGSLLVSGYAPASYGASQFGAILRYRLGPLRPAAPFAYLRATSALANPARPELAWGLGVRPIPGLPMTVLGELRVARNGGQTSVRPAIAAVAGLARQRLPLGFGAEAYGQIGYVAGPDASGFADGQARLDRPIAQLGNSELRGGGAVWGGVQRGAGRLDIGPSASLAFKIGPTSARLAADWRFRVAGQATPASGPAVTLSAGF